MSRSAKGITLKAYLAAILGVISCTPPDWLVRIGIRRAAHGAGALLTATAMAILACVNAEVNFPLCWIFRIILSSCVWAAVHGASLA